MTSHKFGSRLPLLPVITFPIAEHHHHLAAIVLLAVIVEVGVSARLAHIHYMKVQWLRVLQS